MKTASLVETNFFLLLSLLDPSTLTTALNPRAAYSEASTCF